MLTENTSGFSSKVLARMWYEHTLFKKKSSFLLLYRLAVFSPSLFFFFDNSDEVFSIQVTLKCTNSGIRREWEHLKISIAQSNSIHISRSLERKNC